MWCYKKGYSARTAVLFAGLVDELQDFKDEFSIEPVDASEERSKVLVKDYSR